MVSSRLNFFLFAILVLTAQAVARLDLFNNLSSVLDLANNPNYTTNSTTGSIIFPSLSSLYYYEANLNQLLSSLSSNTEIQYGFYNSSYGRNSDQVYAIGLCRGDVHPYVCYGCLNNDASLLRKLYPQQKEAVGWYSECMLRYSNRSILGVMKTSPRFFMSNPNISSANYKNQFNDGLKTLLESLKSQAAAGGPNLKFAAGKAAAPNTQTLYALVQCTPDLSEQECNDCLLGAFQSIPLCCDGKEGRRVMRPSCNIRFEVYPLFYKPTTARSPDIATDTKKIKGTCSIIMVRIS